MICHKLTVIDDDVWSGRNAREVIFGEKAVRNRPAADDRDAIWLKFRVQSNFKSFLLL